MKNYIRISLLMCFVMIVSSCKNQNADQSNASDTPLNTEENVGNTAEEKAVDEKRLKTFLFSTEGTYGWKTASENVSLDFFEDGRLHIQGPDGEATMWEGRWSLTGNILSMSRPDLNTKMRVEAKIDGEKLILDGISYVRSN